MFKYHSDIDHCFSLEVIVVSFFCLLFLIGKNRHGIGQKGAIFDWEGDRNSTPREGQKMPCIMCSPLNKYTFQYARVYCVLWALHVHLCIFQS